MCSSVNYNAAIYGDNFFKPAHGKTYSETFVTNKDADQPVRLPSMARVLVYPSLDSLEAVEGTCDQRTL